MHPSFQRHIDACNDAVLPGDRILLRLGGEAVGWVDPWLSAALADFVEQDEIRFPDPALLPGVARTLAERGFYRYRHEAFDVRGATGVLTTIDRGALPAFGILAEGVHLNGLVHKDDGLHLWVARRAADKLLDPGKLDHLVAGGISAGMGAWDTLIKEAAEEASIDAQLAGKAIRTGEITYAMQRGEGLRRDRLHCYDLILPVDFVPHPADGEVEGFELWPIGRVFETARDTDDFKFNVNLVLIDLFARLGMDV
jgi:8-oxo-dGTP pyrophosphatase MutT (NUDIX family)